MIEVNRKRRWRWLQALTRFLLPSRCVLCAGDAGDDDASLCPGCRGDLQPNLPACPRCAEPLVRAEPLCGRCLKHEPPFQATFAAWRYAWPLDGLVARFKFRGDLAAGRSLSQLFVEQAQHQGIKREGWLVPVPLHRQRLRQRGYDQALELARDIGRGLDVPVLPNLLQRTRATAAQSELDLRQRRRNVRGAFALNPRALARMDARPPLILLDDVMTTGSTVAACARVLGEAGFDHIQVWAIARAPARSGSGPARGSAAG